MKYYGILITLIINNSFILASDAGKTKTAIGNSISDDNSTKTVSTKTSSTPLDPILEYLYGKIPLDQRIPQQENEDDEWVTVTGEEDTDTITQSLLRQSLQTYHELFKIAEQQTIPGSTASDILNEDYVQSDSNLTEEEEETRNQNYSMHLTASLANSILGTPKFRNFILSSAFYLPDLSALMSLPKSELTGAAKEALTKGPAKIIADSEKGAQLNLNPLELCMKSLMDNLKSVYNIMDTASEEERFEMGQMLRNTSLVAQFVNFMKDSQLRKFYNTIFENTSDLSNPLKPGAREQFIQSLEKATTEEEKLEILKKQLAPAYRDTNPEEDNRIAQGLLTAFNHITQQKGKLESTFKSLALMIEHPDIIKAGFAGYRNIDIPLISKSNTSEQRLEDTIAAAKQYNKTQLNTTKKINIEELKNVWETLDGFHSLIEGGRLGIKVINTANSASNFVRTATFGPTIDYDKNVYKNVSEMRTDWNKSWLSTVAKVGQKIITLGGYVVKGAQGTYQLGVQLYNGTMKIMRIADNAKNKTVEIGSTISEATTYLSKNATSLDFYTSTAKRAVNYVSEGSIQTFKKFTSNIAKMFSNERPVDLLALLKEVVTSTDPITNTEISNGFIEYLNNNSEENTAPSTQQVSDTMNFVKTLCKTCYESAIQESTLSEFETQKEILVKALVLEIITENLKKNPQEGEISQDDQPMYEKNLEEFINSATTKLLQEMDAKIIAEEKSKGLWQRTFKGVSNSQYLELLTTQLKTNKSSISNNITTQFEEFNNNPEVDIFHDAPEAITPSSTPSISQISTYETAAFDKLFSADTTTSDYQKGLQRCDIRLQNLLNFTIESTLLQSDNYLQELQTTGIKKFYAGLNENGNSVTRLISGGSSLATILRYVTQTDHRDLESFVNASRMMGNLASDTLVKNFFDTYCNRISQNQAKQDTIRSFLADQTKTPTQKADFLEPYLNSNAQSDAFALSTMLQNHISLPGKQEVFLFYMQHQLKINKFLKNTKLSAQECAQEITKVTNNAPSEEELLRMIPALRNYQKSMSFIQNRKTQFIKKLSYSLKRFFSLFTSKATVKGFTVAEFQNPQDFRPSIEESWMNRLSEARDLPITQPQNATSSELLDVIQQRTPEKLPTPPQENIDDILSLPDQLQQNSAQVDPVDGFVQAFGINDEAIQNSIREWFEDNGQAPTLSILKATIPPRFNGTTSTVFTRKVMCGFKTLTLLQQNKELLTTHNITLTVDYIAQLTESIYNKTLQKIPRGTVINTSISPKDFQASLDSLTVSQLNDALHEVFSIANFSLTTKAPISTGIDPTSSTFTTTEPISVTKQPITTITTDPDPVITTSQGITTNTTTKSTGQTRQSKEDAARAARLRRLEEIQEALEASKRNFHDLFKSTPSIDHE